MYIWTRFYTPFRLGGNWTPKKCKVTVKWITAIHGVDFYEVDTPVGSVVVEGHGGGIVGRDRQAVELDIASCSLEMFQEQCAESKVRGEKAEEVTEEYFMDCYKRGKK